jgi:hypothetical protein
MNTAAISIALLVASLILLVIYGADVLTASIASPEGVRGKGFLPFGEEVRGGVFGGGPVAMSVIAFIFSRNVPSKTTSLLLFINGGLIIAGIILTVFEVNSSSIGGMERTVGSTIMLGLLLIGLGIWKIMLDRKTLSKQQPS